MYSPDYDRYLEKLEMKMNEFLKVARRGSNVKVTALEARKMSMSLREDLKEFRKLSINNDKI